MHGDFWFGLAVGFAFASVLWVPSIFRLMRRCRGVLLLPLLVTGCVSTGTDYFLTADAERVWRLMETGEPMPKIEVKTCIGFPWCIGTPAGLTVFVPEWAGLRERRFWLGLELQRAYSSRVKSWPDLLTWPARWIDAECFGPLSGWGGLRTGLLAASGR